MKGEDHNASILRLGSSTRVAGSLDCELWMRSFVSFAARGERNLLKSLN
jgi:hypothetical protein